MSGSFCISIDLELGWGIWDHPDVTYFDRCVEREHDIVRRLLTLFDRYEISVTWAFVSRLLELDERMAATTRHGAKLWFAPELIEMIQAARTSHDIGSHGYAHIYYDEVSRDEVQQDLASARRAHERFGLPFDSFVFPRNQIAHLDLLREAGIKIYRSLDRGWRVDAARFGRLAGRVAHVASQLLPIAPAMVSPSKHDGIVDLPGSMLMMARRGARQFVPSRLTIAKMVRGQRAARDGGCFHLWFHPSNFYYRTDEQLETLDVVLQHAAKLRDRGQLEIKPMRAYAS